MKSFLGKYKNILFHRTFWSTSWISSRFISSFNSCDSLVPFITHPIVNQMYMSVKTIQWNYKFNARLETISTNVCCFSYVSQKFTLKITQEMLRMTFWPSWRNSALVTRLRWWLSFHCISHPHFTFTTSTVVLTARWHPSNTIEGVELIVARKSDHRVYPLTPQHVVLGRLHSLTPSQPLQYVSQLR